MSVQSIPNIRSKSDDLRHNENLQILRFFAAALVLATHITFYLHERFDPLQVVWHGGEVGVSIFFVISGFVMCKSIAGLPVAGSSARSFFMRRIARLIPLYWLITTLKVAATLLLPGVSYHNKPTWLIVLCSYFLIPTLNGEGMVRPIHGVGWTLLHEMFFYAVLTVGIGVTRRPWLFATLLITGLVLIGTLVPSTNPLALVYLSPVNLLFVCGMGIAGLTRRGWHLGPVGCLVQVVAGILLLLHPALREFQAKGLVGFEMGAVLLVAGLVPLKIAVAPRVRAFLGELGDGSYSLYLVHPLLAPAVCLLLFKIFGLRSDALIVLISFVTCVGLGQLVYRFVELPMNRTVKSWLVVK